MIKVSFVIVFIFMFYYLFLSILKLIGYFLKFIWVVIVILLFCYLMFWMVGYY